MSLCRNIFLIIVNEWVSGGHISCDQNRRSKDFAIMRSTKICIFREIKIPNKFFF
jgi:hypothetical protein